MDDVDLGHRFKKWISLAGAEMEILFCRKPIGLSLRTIEARRDYRGNNKLQIVKCSSWLD